MEKLEYKQGFLGDARHEPFAAHQCIVIVNSSLNDCISEHFTILTVSLGCNASPPVYAPKILAAETSKTSALNSAATERVTKVFPQPGGPCSSKPLGQFTPREAPSQLYINGQPAHQHLTCNMRSASATNQPPFASDNWQMLMQGKHC